MVPLGPMAFMPGELVHTNEVLVLLGDNYFAEQSATQAVAIMQRRIGVIDTIISKTETNIKDLTARNNFSDEARKALLRKLDSGAEPPEVPADLQQRAEEDDDEEGLVSSVRTSCACSSCTPCTVSPRLFQSGSMCVVINGGVIASACLRARVQLAPSLSLFFSCVSTVALLRRAKSFGVQLGSLVPLRTTTTAISTTRTRMRKAKSMQRRRASIMMRSGMTTIPC
jgi:hypothetical protein